MEITPELITQYGLMSKISTGNTFMDFVFCLLVPLLLKHLIPRLAALPSRLWPTKAAEKTFSRIIEYTQRSYYYWYDSDSQPPNSILQRAVLNLINRQVATLSDLREADVAIKKKPPANRLGLTDCGSKGSEEGGDCGSDGGDEADEGGSEHAYSFNLMPPSGQWVDLKNGIRFMLETESLDDKHKSTKLRYRLESRERDGNERIAAFLQEALEAYRLQQSSRVDSARYLYMPVLSGAFREPPPATSDGDGGSRPAAAYKRYKLSEEKTFASLFHPDKQAMLRLVDQFLAKSGKFAIPGYPQKLGFLLYGPPGTGKTSLIKALAQYTRRSIISVPLSKISTNQELMDIVFDNKLQIANRSSTDSDAAISLPFDKTIFVMEDVDAASSVVARRNNGGATLSGGSPGTVESAQQQQDARVALAEQFAAAELAAAVSKRAASRRAASTPSRDTASSSRDDGEDSDDQDGDAEEGDADGEKGGGSSSGGGGKAGAAAAASGEARHGGVIAGGGNCSGGGWGSAMDAATTPGVAIGPSLPLGAWGAKGLGSLFRGDDELNLAGLLNVLDGVVDTPNRIIIMTTNHPDKLDPALIRPGRINKKIYMGRLRLAEALSMMRHYFGGPHGLSAADEGALRAVWVDERLSPADLEAMCAEYDSPGEMVEALAARLAGGGGEEAFRAC